LKPSSLPASCVEGEVAITQDVLAGSPTAVPSWPAAGAAISVSRAIDFRISSLPADAGLELPLELPLSSRLGHASIQITADRYGRLFPSTDDGSELAAAEKAILRSVSRK
jgi:hypothetical protein